MTSTASEPVDSVQGMPLRGRGPLAKAISANESTNATMNANSLNAQVDPAKGTRTQALREPKQDRGPPRTR